MGANAGGMGSATGGTPGKSMTGNGPEQPQEEVMSNVTERDDSLFRLFTRFDRNGDGLIDIAEFRAILEALGDSPSQELASLEFAAIDMNSDGMVDFPEFKGWWLDYK
jgi:Ca2+-binding EF-hand superfamily protein